MIVVTGANGPFGRQLVERLLDRVPAQNLAVSVRDPDATTPLAERGVTVRHGNFDAPETLASAFAGAETILINATNYGTSPGDRARQQAAAIHASIAAGVDRLVVTSWLDLEHCGLEMASDFPATESLTPATGTIARINYGMAAALARDVLWARKAGVLTAPAGDAHATPAATADLAEAVAAILVEPGHEGRTYELSGPDAVSWDDLAALASIGNGHPIEYRAVSDDEFRQQRLAHAVETWAWN